MTAADTGPQPYPSLEEWAPSRTDEHRSDDELVANALSDRGALADIYDRYGERLFEFCAGLLHDRDAAADCVQDVFVTAATELGRLRDPAKLRAWLYAIARHRALRDARHRRREVAVDEIPEQRSRAAGPDEAASRTELHGLVVEVSRGLPDRDRAILEMYYRHDLDHAEIAEALGLSATNTATLLGRARATFQRSLGATLVGRRARAGRSECAELAQVIASWDGTLSVLWRKRIARHIEGCAVCSRDESEFVNPRTFLGAVPLVVPAPAWLRPEVLERTAASSPRTGGSWWPPAVRVGLGAPLVVSLAAPLIAVPTATMLLLASPGAAPHGGSSAPSPTSVAAPTATSRPRARFGVDMPTTVLPPAGAVPLAPGAAPGAVPTSAELPLVPRGPAASSPDEVPVVPPSGGRRAPSPEAPVDPETERDAPPLQTIAPPTTAPGN
ncbi:sigma-70 family RNA polymerase sigma factor [Actinomycetospora atypica]|uniref:Sigma-70 family RNA polymerase sigma factor n=1 Tax=Actinomycetospora atypica TaxID=1290095 RepID=A0ABV9YJ59_9PSEU